MGNECFASCVLPCYQNDQLVREIKVVARHETVNAEFVIMMCEISEISDAGQYLPDISTLHYTRSQPPCRDSNLQGLSKNEIFSLLLLLLPDLIWSLEIISSALTLLSKYVNIIANYFLAPCTFYFRLKIEFVFLKSDNSTLVLPVVCCTPRHTIARIKVTVYHNVGRFAENKP